MDNAEHEVEEKTYTIYTRWIVDSEVEVSAKSSKKALTKARNEHETFFREHGYGLLNGTGWVESDEDEEPKEESNLEKEVEELTNWVNSRPKKE